jgi:hypothetical protein
MLVASEQGRQPYAHLDTDPLGRLRGVGLDAATSWRVAGIAGAGTGDQIGDDLLTDVVLPVAIEQAQVDVRTQRTDPAGMPSAFGSPAPVRPPARRR